MILLSITRPNMINCTDNSNYKHKILMPKKWQVHTNIILLHRSFSYNVDTNSRTNIKN